ncbi:ribbon-helix-helix protein, CopG family [Caulobacter sp. SSI4214]|uniref:ribbon-helix-helix protein, CopG family n=1 Tax=Caulobacter sp. SSI4214 TaxID=2575739 RepID=UPI00143AB8B6|nr:ribbon-helix-helix protein, CopG family [Caulobacter sp. SSI4214]
MTAGAKVQAKVFLPGDLVRELDEAARRLRRSKSEIVRAAVASYLSADGAEAGEAAVTRRLDRMSRQIERLERDLTIANEAVALFVRTWLRNSPALATEDQASGDLGRERYARFLEVLARRLASGKLLREEVGSDLSNGGV